MRKHINVKICKYCNNRFDTWSINKNKQFCNILCSNRYKNQSKYERNLSKYNTSPKYCLECNSMLSYEESKANKFCSHNCSAKFNNSKRAPRTIESRNKTSESLKGRKHTSSITQQKILKYKPITNCIICSKPTGNHTRVTCSLDCRKIHATNNALNRPCSQGGRGYKGKYKGISLDSTWELAYLIYHLDHNIDICRSTNIYEYVFNDHTYKYKPDFIVNGQEIEIKGYMSDRSKAKMSQNLNIIVIDKLSINFYINYVKGKYNTKNLKDLYD